MPKPPTCRRCNTAHWSTQRCPLDKQEKVARGKALADARAAEVAAKTKALAGLAKEQPATIIGHDYLTRVRKEYDPDDLVLRIAELEAEKAARRKRKAEAQKRWRASAKKRKE